MRGADLNADLFDYRSLLDKNEQGLLDDLRAWLTEHLAPIADQQWAKAEFPHDIVPSFGELGVVGLPYDLPGTPTEGRLLSGFVSLEISRIDSSFASFYGCAQRPGHGLDLLLRFGRTARALATGHAQTREDRRLRPHRTARRLDVAGGLETTARRDGGNWVLDGAKRWIATGRSPTWLSSGPATSRTTR